MRSRFAGQDGEEGGGERACESRDGGGRVHGDLVREPQGVERIEERDMRTRVFAQDGLIGVFGFLACL